MFTVRIINLDETVKALREVDAGGANRLRSEIRRIAKPTLAKARAYAGGLGSSPTGSYAGSLSIKSTSTGASWVSNDPGGGVIEFANIGALILEGPRQGRRAGVPHGSQPPRALLKAVLEDEDSIVRSLDRAVAQYVDEVFIVG